MSVSTAKAIHNEATDAQFVRMTQEPIRKLLIQMGIPTVISMMVTSVYNIGDTYFVSQLGTSASGGVSTALPVQAIIQAMGFMLGMGSGSQISRLLGAKKVEESEKIAVSGFFAAITFGVIIAVFGLLNMEWVLTMLRATPTIRPYCREYLSIILFGAPIMAGSFVLNNILRSQGNAKFAMVGISTGAILNLFLDPLFIFGLDMGIAGAALATVVSQCISFFLLLGAFLIGKSAVKLRLRRISLSPVLHFRTISNGFPSFVRQALSSIATILLNGAAAEYGDGAVAAMGIVGKVFMIIFAVGLGIGQGYMPVLGYNYGAKQYKRVRESLKFTLGLGTCLMTGMGIIIGIFAPYIIKAFIADNPIVVEVGTAALRAQCISLPLLAMGVVSNMTYQTIGKSFIASLLSSARQGIFYIPMILILPRVIGLTGVEITQSAADVLTFVLCVPFVVSFLRKMKKEEMKAAEENLPVAEETTA
ncbi:MAG: MATE family efflux transporter [Ruminococcaceae bacterium]|nr:MATE family efflux transporter [Oscillospiraceae bacterium]